MCVCLEDECYSLWVVYFQIPCPTLTPYKEHVYIYAGPLILQAESSDHPPLEKSDGQATNRERHFLVIDIELALEKRQAL